MAYKYKNSKGYEYTLHARITKNHGKEQPIYYFAREQKEGALDTVPEGYKIVENALGLPILQRAFQKNKS